MMTLLILLSAAAVVFASSFISMAAEGGIGNNNNNGNIPSRNQDMEVAKEEMQKANYFAYVMLINLAPSDLFLGNVTFLMPNDRTLAKNIMPENCVADFLLRHSIPSPLLMEHLQHFPTGSILPTSKPDLFLRITNNGRRSFFLNNVRIISPNICTLGSSIRCHGIDGLIQDSAPPPPPAAADQCHNTKNSSTTTTTSPPSAAAPSAPTTDNKNNTSTTSGSTAAPPTGGNHPKKSAASVLNEWYFGGCEIMTVGLTLLLMKLCV